MSETAPTGARRAWGDARIPRWHCPDAHKTWSLLARCFAARLPGTLDELEAAALAAETEPSLRAAAERARPGHAVTEAANRRWLKGRRDLTAACLVTVITLLPELFAGCEPSVTALRACLGTARLIFRIWRARWASARGLIRRRFRIRPANT